MDIRNIVAQELKKASVPVKVVGDFTHAFKKIDVWFQYPAGLTSNNEFFPNTIEEWMYNCIDDVHRALNVLNARDFVFGVQIPNAAPLKFKSENLSSGYFQVEVKLVIKNTMGLSDEMAKVFKSQFAATLDFSEAKF